MVAVVVIAVVVFVKTIRSKRLLIKNNPSPKALGQKVLDPKKNSVNKKFGPKKSCPKN